MKTFSVITLAASLGLAALTNPATAHTEKPVFGRVIHSEPRYEYRHIRQPSTHCSYPKRRHTHTAIGSAVGALVGLQHSQSADGALIGGLIGAGVGHSIDHYQHGGNSHCRTQHHTHTQKVLTGYQVTYRYRGHTYSTLTPHRPGRRIEHFEHKHRHTHNRHSKKHRQHGPHQRH